MASTPKTDHPLAPFARLGPSIYLQEPQSPDDDKNAGNHPKTIILAFWMNAPARALAKYVVEYRRLAPSARIIFIRSSSHDFLLRFTRRQHQARLAPAIEAVRASITPEEPVFVHMFSNGGVFSTINLLEGYLNATGQRLRVSSLVFDSAPGFATVTAGVKAMAFVLPRARILHFLSKMFLWLLFAFGEFVRRIIRTPDAVSIAREAINDKRLVCGPEGGDSAPTRCYVYSDADELVLWEDVEKHASEAESKGWVVRREKFLGSPHVAHMKSDPERYWKIVTDHLEWPESE
ncbi:hypothetical protein FE257_011245 [Aspergillus nanangensis]|uniref:Indole-diterpene biosynthesis protein PaxU n=1 Tax=Aspergillus nanangensis TaxID=2582783 RepID=A0AAD4CHJ7_ASPNN|nr:hypothetical protein FE257_011245 [Aspergillus nanangensis]